MREIKFRGKRIDNGEWVYGYLSFIYVDGKDENGFIFTEKASIYDQEACKRYDVYTKTVGQYTGLRDKNEKEIYEGDIFNCIYDFDGCTKHKLEVVYDEESAKFALKNHGECHQPNVSKSVRDMERKEVIGNICENKDLLIKK